MSNVSCSKTVLLMDDEFTVLESMRMLLCPYYQVHLAENQYIAEKIVEKNRIDLVIVEPRMSDLNQNVFFKFLLDKNRATKVIIVSSNRPNELRAQSEHLEVSTHITKPFDCSFFLNAVALGLAQK